MANDFSSTEVEYFDMLLEGFDKDLTISNEVTVEDPSPEAMQNHGDQYWVPVPYIAETFDGLDLSAVTPSDLIDMQVPCTLSYLKSTLWSTNSMENRSSRYLEQQAKASRQKLASDVEASVATTLALTGGQVVKVGALTGYDDLAECEATLNEVGIPRDSRKFVFNDRDKNKVASNLSKSAANFGRSEPATGKSQIGNFANFDVMSSDMLPRLRDASAATGATVSGADQTHVPVATVATATGTNLVDNRFQTLTVSSTASMQVGDRFTIAGVNKVNMISKDDTAIPFTNTVIEIVSGTVIRCLAMIGPATAGGSVDSIYKNISAAPADGAVLTFLNTTDAQVNAFWHQSSVQIDRGHIATADLGNGGVGVMRGTTDNGVEIVMMKESSLRTTKTEYRFFTFWGVTNTNPLMNGVLLAGQA